MEAKFKVGDIVRIIKAGDSYQSRRFADKVYEIWNVHVNNIVKPMVSYGVKDVSSDLTGGVWEDEIELVGKKELLYYGN